MNLSYKDQHEIFVTGHDGTSILEVSAVSFVAPIAFVLRNCMLNWIAGPKGYNPAWLVGKKHFLGNHPVMA